jgi:hypothetical protein
MLRQGAGLVTLQSLFDNLDQSQKLLGKIHLQLMQSNWTPGKVSRIINEEPSDEFYNRAFSQYDAIVEEAPLTSTQKQMALQQALYLKELGVPIPTEYLLDNMQLPDKNELIEKITKQEQAQYQQEQQMAQLQMQQLHVDNETKISYAEGQRALAAERLNKIRLDAAVSAERIQKSEEESTGAFLNLVKAVKEIEGMGVEQIAQAVQIMKTTQEMHLLNKQTPEVQQLPTQEVQQLQTQEVPQMQPAQPSPMNENVV